ncbi:MAG TPA: rhomboid family intramembrane serine protease [Acidimicrobiales bacterium]|nr:rhomboid family intramembrane serine protease [Acidimicrobiales bacterium]
MALPLRDDSTAERAPIVTWALIVANVVVFLLLQPPVFQSGALDTGATSADPARQRAVAEEHVNQWGVIPCEVRRLEPLVSEPEGCDRGTRLSAVPDEKHVPLSLLTHMFLHGGVIHLVGNMFFLWLFGKNVEDRLGHAAFLGLYVVTGILAMLGHVAANLTDAVPAVGASGAVSGVMGAYVIFHPHTRILTLVPNLVFQVVYLPAYVLLGLYFVLQFFTPDIAQVAWVAHVAGMVAGGLLALAVEQRSRLRRASPQRPDAAREVPV